MAQGCSLQDAVHAAQASNPLASAEQLAMAAIAAQAAQQAQQSARANTRTKPPADLIDRATRQVADAHVFDAKVVDQAGQSLKRPVQLAAGKPDLTRLHAPAPALVDRIRVQMQAGATPAEAVNVLRAEAPSQQPDTDLDLAVAALMADAAEHGGSVANALPLAMRDLGATFPAATLTLAFSQADIAVSTDDCNQAVADYRAAERSGAPAGEQDSKLARANAALSRLQRAVTNGMRCVADNAPDADAAARLIDAFGQACVAAATPELRQQLTDCNRQAAQAVLAESSATRHSNMALYLLAVDQGAAADVGAAAADTYAALAQKHLQAAQARVDAAQTVLHSNRKLPDRLRRAEAPSDTAALNQAQRQLMQANAEVADAQAQQQAAAAGKDVVLPANAPELSSDAASLADLQRATSGALADFKRALGNEVAQDATQAYVDDAHATLQAAQHAASPSRAVPASLRRAEELDNLGSLHDAQRTARDAQAQQNAAAANKPVQVPQADCDQGVAAAQRAHAGQGLDEAIARASLSGQVDGAAAPLTRSTPGLTAFEQTLAGCDTVTLGLVRTSQFDLTQVQTLPAAERVWLLGSLSSADAAFTDPRRTQQVAGRLQQLAILKLAGVTLDWNAPAVQRDPFPWAAQHATPEQKQIMGRWVAAADDARVLWVQEHCNAQAPAGDPRDPSHIGAVQSAMQIAAINRNNALTLAAAGVIDQMTASTFGPAFWSDQIGQLLQSSGRDMGLQTVGLVRVGQFMKQLAPYMSAADASRALDWIKANYKEDWFDNNPEALSDAGAWYEGVAALVQAALPERNRGAEFATWLTGPQSTLARYDATTRDALLASAQQMGANGDQQLPEALRAALKPVDPDAAQRLDDYYQGGLQSFVSGKGYLTRDDRASYAKTQWAAYQALPDHAAEEQLQTLVGRISETPYTPGSTAFHNALGLSLGMTNIGTSTDAQARANRVEQWLNTPGAPIEAATEWFTGDRLADAGNVIGAFDTAIANGIREADATAFRNRAPRERWSLTVMPMRAYGEQSGQTQMALVRVQGDRGTTFYVGSRGGSADDPMAKSSTLEDFRTQTALTTKDCLVMPKGGNVARSGANGAIAMETVAGHINSTLDDINDATGIPMLIGGLALGVVAALSTGPVGLAAELLIALPTATLGLANLANMAGHDRSLTSGEAIGTELMVAAAGAAGLARTLEWGARLPAAARSAAEAADVAGNASAVGRSGTEAVSSEVSGVHAAGAVDGVAAGAPAADLRPVLARAAQRLRAVAGVTGSLQAAQGLQQLAAVWDDPEQRDHALFMQVMNFAAMVGMAPLMGGVRALRERRAAGRADTDAIRTVPGHASYAQLGESNIHVPPDMLARMHAEEAVSSADATRHADASGRGDTEIDLAVVHPHVEAGRTRALRADAIDIDVPASLRDREPALRELIGQATQASMSGGALSDCVDAVHLIHRPGQRGKVIGNTARMAFYVTDEGERIIEMDAAALDAPFEQRLTGLCEEIVHAQRHARRTALYGPRYSDNLSVNERTAMRLARIRALAFIAREVGFDDADWTGRLVHDDVFSKALSDAADAATRAEGKLLPEGIRRAWFEAGSGYDEPRQPEAETKEIKKAQAKRLGKGFTALCFSLAEKLALFHAENASQANPFAPLDMQKMVRMPLSDVLFDENQLPRNVLPDGVTGFSLLQAMRYVDTLRGRFASMAPVGKQDMLPSMPFQEALLPIPDGDHQASINDNLAIPVGEYGEQLSADIMRASVVMKNAARRLLAHEVLQMQTKEGELIAHTDLGTAMGVFLDGIDSVANAAIQSLARKNGGPDDPIQALRLIIEHKIPDELALRFGFGALGPTLLQGRAYTDLIVWTDGKPVVNPKLKSAIRQQNNALTDDYAYTNKPMTGQGCPVRGIQVLSEAFLQIVESYAQQRDAGAFVPLEDVGQAKAPAPSRFTILSEEIPTAQLLRDHAAFNNVNLDLLDHAEKCLREVQLELIRAEGVVSDELRSRFLTAMHDQKLAESERAVILAAGALRTHLAQSGVPESITDNLLDIREVTGLLDDEALATYAMLIQRLNTRREEQQSVLADNQALRMDLVAIDQAGEGAGSESGGATGDTNGPSEGGPAEPGAAHDMPPPVIPPSDSSPLSLPDDEGGEGGEGSRELGGVASSLTAAFDRDRDIHRSVRSLGLPQSEVAVVGNSVVDMLGYQADRPAQPTHLLVSEERYRALREGEGWTEQARPDGSRILTAPGFHVTTSWAGQALPDIHAAGNGYWDQGVRVADPSLAYAQMLRRQAPGDERDLELIRQHLYGTAALPPELVAAQLNFVRACMQPELRQRPELLVAARNLYVVNALFGRGEEEFLFYSGSAEINALAAAHGWAHSGLGVRDAQANIDMLDGRRVREGLPPLFSADDRVATAVGYAGHDGQLGHGRMATNPEGHDERVSADMVVRQLEAAGHTDPVFLETVYEGIMSTTFDEATRGQLIVPGGRHLHVQKLFHGTDLASLRRDTGLTTSIANSVENLSRRSAGFDRPLAQLIEHLNRELPAGSPPLVVTSMAQALELIQEHGDFPTTRMNGDASTLREDFADTLIGSSGFYRNHRHPDLWVMGDTQWQMQMGDELLALGTRVKEDPAFSIPAVLTEAQRYAADHAPETATHAGPDVPPGSPASGDDPEPPDPPAGGIRPTGTDPDPKPIGGPGGGAGTPELEAPSAPETAVIEDHLASKPGSEDEGIGAPDASPPQAEDRQAEQRDLARAVVTLIRAAIEHRRMPSELISKAQIKRAAGVVDALSRRLASPDAQWRGRLAGLAQQDRAFVQGILQDLRALTAPSALTNKAGENTHERYARLTRDLDVARRYLNTYSGYLQRAALSAAKPCALPPHLSLARSLAQTNTARDLLNVVQKRLEPVQPYSSRVEQRSATQLVLDGAALKIYSDPSLTTLPAKEQLRFADLAQRAQQLSRWLRTRDGVADERARAAYEGARNELAAAVQTYSKELAQRADQESSRLALLQRVYARDGSKPAEGASQPLSDKPHSIEDVISHIENAWEKLGQMIEELETVFNADASGMSDSAIHKLLRRAAARMEEATAEFGKTIEGYADASSASGLQESRSAFEKDGDQEVVVINKEPTVTQDLVATYKHMVRFMHDDLMKIDSLQDIDALDAPLSDLLGEMRHCEERLRSALVERADETGGTQ
ncbi:hypothetical protein [Ralstonia sp.]|uniref:hypothetical protein n=1 Tax=Ralstonia sp. TaxID=54061 RepID=UPI0031CEB48D